MLSAIPEFNNLKIDEYVRDFQEKEKERLLLFSENQDTENKNTNNQKKHDENAEHTIEALRKEIEKIKTEKDVQVEVNRKLDETLQKLIQEKAEQEIKNAMLENEGKRQGIVPGKQQVC